MSSPNPSWRRALIGSLGPPPELDSLPEAQRQSAWTAALQGALASPLVSWARLIPAIGAGTTGVVLALAGNAGLVASIAAGVAGATVGAVAGVLTAVPLTRSLARAAIREKGV